jgi:predicted membrane protein
MLPSGKWAIYGWVTQIILWKMVIFHGSNRLTSRSWSFGQIFWGGVLRILWKYQTVSYEYYIRVHWFYIYIYYMYKIFNILYNILYIY